jgi:chlorobactene glucosyltransferase
MTILFWLLFLFAAFFFLLAVSNVFFAPVLPIVRSSEGEQLSFSMIIPVRNEESNLPGLLSALNKLTYSRLEIVFVDDCSTDRTPYLLTEAVKADQRLRVINGGALPRGWRGKPHACWVGAGSATGEILLFMDADVVPSPDFIESLNAVFQMQKPAAVSVLPGQVYKSWGERLVVPMMMWLLLTFLPLALVFRSRHPSLTAANGQCFAFTRESYDDIGGHAAVKNQVVEDMELGRLLKSKGKNLLPLLGSAGLQCRMYSSFSEAVNGFTKNFYPGFRGPKIAFACLLLFTFGVFCFPFIALTLDKRFMIIVALLLLERAAVALRSGDAVLINCVLYPVQILVFLYIGIRSLLLSGKGHIYWKGRSV